MTQLIQFFSPSFNPKGRVIFFFWGLNICGKKTIEICISLEISFFICLCFFISLILQLMIRHRYSNKKMNTFFSRNHSEQWHRLNKTKAQAWHKKYGKKIRKEVYLILLTSFWLSFCCSCTHSLSIVFLNLRNILKSDMPMLDP